MRKKIVLIVFLFHSIFSLAQSTKQIYSSPNLQKIIGNAKTAAILPMNVTISYKKMPKDVSVEMIKEDEKKESINMQQGMYTYLLRKADDYTVTFQDPERTNALLRKALVFDILNEASPDSLCKILGVDVVIKSSWSYKKTGSQGASIATGLLFGISSSTASGQLIMQVYDGPSGELAWRMAKEMNEDAFSTANELMERMMRKVGRNFPFTKK